MEQQDELFSPSSARILADKVLFSDDNHFSSGVVIPATVRIDAFEFAAIEVFVERTGLSRNKIVNLMLSAGVEAMYQEIDQGNPGIGSETELKFLQDQVSQKLLSLVSNVKKPSSSEVGQ